MLYIASAKSWSARAASHQPAFMGSLRFVTCVCPAYLQQMSQTFCLCPLLIGLIVILSTFFSHGEYGFTSVGSCCYLREWAWDSRTKLCCIASGKEIPSGFHYRALALGICCLRLYNSSVFQYFISTGFDPSGPRSFPRRRKRI